MTEGMYDAGGDRSELHRRMDLEIARLLAETSKLSAETSKISAETSRINREMSSYPWLPIMTATLGSTGVIGAIVALVIAFHR
jgi:hypothetical protein